MFLSDSFVVSSKTSEKIFIKDLMEGTNVLCFNDNDIISESVQNNIQPIRLKEHYRFIKRNNQNPNHLKLLNSYTIFKINNILKSYTVDTIFVTKGGLKAIIPTMDSVTELKQGDSIFYKNNWVQITNIEYSNHSLKDYLYNFQLNNQNNIFIVNGLLIYNKE